MHLTDLTLDNFRNITHMDLTFDRRLSIISGDNGSGKTSILEAIYFLSLGRSFRSNQIQHIISHEHTSFTLFAKLNPVITENSDRHKSTITLASQRQKNGKNTIKINGKNENSQAALSRILPVQLINPESFTLLNSGAQARLKMLDWGTFYHHAPFLSHWQQYRRLVKQRNIALKQNYNKDYIHILDAELSRRADAIDQYRQSYYQQLKPAIFKMLDQLKLSLRLDIDYYRGWAADQTLLEALDQHYYQDSKTGITSVGSHRGDLRFKIHKHPAGDILSRGQQKLLISAIRLAEGQLYQRRFQSGVLYLVDDLHSELDSQHLSHLFDKLTHLDSQIIATAISDTHLGTLSQKYQPKKFRLAEGVVT
ncbi:MAG: DNA replication/repair protein RecF [Francisellaceae bacterium]